MRHVLIGVGAVLFLVACGGTPSRSNTLPRDAGGGTTGSTTACSDSSECSGSGSFCINSRCGSCRGTRPLQCPAETVCSADGDCVALAGGTSGSSGSSGTSGSSGSTGVACTHRSDCPGAEACPSVPGGECGAPAPDAGCASNDDCVKAFICQAHRCIAGCNNSLDCHGTEEPVCVPGNPGHCGPCTASAQCLAGEVCLTGQCVPGTPCSSAATCPDNLGCVSGLCGPCTANGQCAAPDSCDLGTQRCALAQTTSGSTTVSSTTSNGMTASGSSGATTNTTGTSASTGSSGSMGTSSTSTTGSSSGSGTSSSSGSGSSSTTGGSSTGSDSGSSQGAAASSSTGTGSSSGSSTAGTSTGGGSSDLLFSEYLEGEGSNKALELYNPTGNVVALDGYEIRLSSNGVLAADGGVTSALAFQADAGQLAPGATLVVCNLTFASGTGVPCAIFSDVAAFNGDDTIVLTANGSVVDSIGDGTRPSAGYWGDATTNTLNHDLRRACGATGRTNVTGPFDPASAGWSAFVDTDFSDLGTHVCP